MSEKINTPSIFKKSGGFRRLHSLNFATIVHLGSMRFCKRFITWKDDPLGKTVGQMVGASRSCKQNIIEGSVSAQTSSETEIKLTNVAKASMAELAGDLEDYIGSRDAVPWSIHSQEHQSIAAIQSVLWRMPSGHYNTDLGYSLNNFNDDYMDTLNSGTTLIVVGDGRNPICVITTRRCISLALE